MILVDTNLLVYAYVNEVPQHEAALKWLDRQLNEVSKVGLPWAPARAHTRFPMEPLQFISRREASGKISIVQIQSQPA